MRASIVTLALAALVACGSDDSDTGPGPNPDGGANAGDVPTSADAMFAYLQAGDYTSYDAESDVHTSAGPHGAGGVRTYINDALASSLASGATEHPVGAAAIKELYASDGETVSGWAAEVKVSAGSGGSTWYFYEVFSTTDGSRPIEGNGNGTCTGCHAAGVDYVRVAFPLE